MVVPKELFVRVKIVRGFGHARLIQGFSKGQKMAKARYLLPLLEVRDMAGRHNLLQNVAKA